MEIIPSILEQTKEGVLEKLEAVHSMGLTVQIDICDGAFTPNQTVQPDDLPAELRAVPWEAHLMVSDPVTWSGPIYARQCQRVYWHAEVLPNAAIIPRHFTTIEHGLALRLETPVSIVDQYVPIIRSVLLLSIDEPGFQGKKFQESVYEKIKALKHKHPGVKLAVDGGIGMEHLKPLKMLGVDRVIVGSAFWKFNDPKTVLAAFRQATL